MGTFAQQVNGKSEQANSSSRGETAARGAVSSAANENGATPYSMIGKSISIKGEITATDPVYVYGSVEGLISAPAHRVTVGKEGMVKANIRAREVVIMGDVCGNLDCGERVEIRGDGSLMGDLSTSRIFIEEGAVLSGSIEVHKATKKAPEKDSAEVEPKGVAGLLVVEAVEGIAS